MATDEERRADATKFRAIDEAFRKGDLDGLRAAVDDPTAVPNGRIPDGIGTCLVYAIYHSPMATAAGLTISRPCWRAKGNRVGGAFLLD